MRAYDLLGLCNTLEHILNSAGDALGSARFSMAALYNHGLLLPHVTPLREVMGQPWFSQMAQYRSELAALGMQHSEPTDEISAAPGMQARKIVDEAAYADAVAELNAKYADAIESDKLAEELLGKPAPDVAIVKVKFQEVPQTLQLTAIQSRFLLWMTEGMAPAIPVSTETTS